MKSHAKFATDLGLGYPLLADPELTLLKSLGVWREKLLYGKKYFGVERSTFLVGTDGRVERAWRGVKVKGHVDEVLGSL